MHTTDWLQFALYLGLLTLITKPMGLYLMQVLDTNGRTWLDPVLKPLERITYKLLGVDPQREQGWKQYTFAMLAFSLVGVVFTYAILRLQDVLPWNPQGLPALSHHLAFNTAVSFTTNTNWQSYGGESTLSYFSQMVRQNFLLLIGIVLVGALNFLPALALGPSLRTSSWTRVSCSNFQLLTAISGAFGKSALSR